jgi:dTDP-4-amino-4,6-dideoxygalactose transaminase
MPQKCFLVHVENEMDIPLLDLKRQYQGQLKARIDLAIRTVCDEQSFILGRHVLEFEQAISSYTDVKHAIGVASGSDAILIALMSAGIGQGDEVLTSPFTFFATAGSIARIGAIPVFVDIDSTTFNLNPNLVQKTLSDTTRAILAVNLFGQMAYLSPMRAMASKRGIPLIEDSAQSLGATHDRMHTGRTSYAACLSFFPSKNLGGFGDGGMIVTNDNDTAEMCRALRSHGRNMNNQHNYVGLNSRLDSLQAAVLHAKLSHLDLWTTLRQFHASRYNKAFAGHKWITTPCVFPGNEHTYNQYTLRITDGGRDHLHRSLKKDGIESAIYYPQPLHLQPCFTHLGYKAGDFPVAEKACNEVISLPIYPEMTPDEQQYIIDRVLEHVPE